MGKNFQFRGEGLMSKENSKYVNCCLCGADDDTYLYHDYQGNRYVRCNKCGLVYQNPRKVTQYENNYWMAAIDPDGKVRHLLQEREDKIKNQYDGDIKYIHKLNPGKILDVGCGPSFFLSAINKQWEKYGVDISEFASDYALQHFQEINVGNYPLVPRNPSHPHYPHYTKKCLPLLFPSWRNSLKLIDRTALPYKRVMQNG